MSNPECHTLTADNFPTSCDELLELKDKGLAATATVRPSRLRACPLPSPTDAERLSRGAVSFPAMAVSRHVAGLTMNRLRKFECPWCHADGEQTRILAVREETHPGEVPCNDLRIQSIDGSVDPCDRFLRLPPSNQRGKWFVS